MLLYAKVATPKVPKKRSRAGCTQCKEKVHRRPSEPSLASPSMLRLVEPSSLRLQRKLQTEANSLSQKKKCNEERPACQRCAEKQLECIYEAVKPRQRKRHASREPLSPLSPVVLQRKPPHLDLAFQDVGGNFDFWADEGVTPIAETPAHSIQGNLTSDMPLGSAPTPAPGHGEMPLSPADLPLFSPTISTAFALAPYSSGPADDEEGNPDEHGVGNNATELVPLSPQYGRRDSFLLSTQQPRQQFQFSIPLNSFVSPLYSEFSDAHRHRTLVDHFSNVLARLIVLNEESGNPFQRLILPMCQSSDAVRNAVYALASAHREYRGLIGPAASASDTENSAFFYNQAIQGIAKLIERGTNGNRNELLAAIMLVVYYEVLVKEGQTNIVDGHLKGAMSILNASDESLDATGAFLERAFRFYEVIAALSFGTAPLSKDTSGGLGALRKDAANSSVDTLLGMASTLWPILHKLSTLLSLKKELEAAPASNIGPTKVSALQTEFETRAYAVDVALKRWKPNLPQQFLAMNDEEQGATGEPIGTFPTGSGNAPNTSETATAAERAHLHSVLNSALAYQHSAIVYLHRTIYGHSRNHALVQRHTHVSLTHCVATVRNGGPMGALLWPLFVAACEAVTLSDRDLASQAFLAIERRQGMINIERSWAVVQEVWRRADAAEELSKPWTGGMGGNGNGNSCIPIFKGRDLWRRISEEMGVTIVLG
ncbi:hypothetical protein jhhlp_008084 [Lomentospora prolificans]|uniref:Zn(2)-C6 fungal-type domain-containing protein n=1 Tax=Lomentospora prolificans TaxID=41688 RepID=A0A2N3MZF8_9PEZI|nr:hypothetical protein jhhlp_008084 [Lomentospora prolificans]